MIGLTYNETVRLIRVVVDGYGKEAVGEEEYVGAIVGQVTGWTHGANRSNIAADSVAYLDPTNEFVVDNYNRLEGMLLVTNLFGEWTWYRIINVSVGTDNLLTNNIDNIQVDLKKTSRLSGVVS